MKIVALNSGGFDSVVMLHYIHEMQPYAEVHSLHFDYGQRSREQEERCARKVCDKLGYEYHDVFLESFQWTKSNFYKDGYVDNETQELEYRNLVFLSYALSLAKAIGADCICAAILKSMGYVDTSKKFLGLFNEICNLSDIELRTPFSEYSKEDLFDFAFDYGITTEEFFSCDNPLPDGEPCRKCPDCEILQNMYSLIENPTPEMVLAKNSLDTGSIDFANALLRTEIKEVRVYTNNKCQLKCDHCYYGFDEMKSPALTKDEMKSALVQFMNQGVKSFHFCGKEPLFDDSVFEYTKFIKSVCPGAVCSLVTNGVNVPRYIDEIKEAGFEKVSVSVESSPSIMKKFRHYFPKTALELLRDNNVPTEVFIDVSKGGYSGLESTIPELIEVYGVSSIYVRFVIPIGNAENFERVSDKEVGKVFNVVRDYSLVYKNVSFTLHVPHLYRDAILECSKEASDTVRYANNCVYDNFFLNVETYCSRYCSQVTLTPDGYVLGCASETASPNYDKISVGNVRESRVSDLLKAGKKKCIECNCRISGKFDHCTFLDETT